MKKTDIHLTITESVVANKMGKKRYRNGMNKTVHKAAKKKKNRLVVRASIRASKDKEKYDKFSSRVLYYMDLLCDCPCSNKSLGINGCLPSYCLTEDDEIDHNLLKKKLLDCWDTVKFKDGVGRLVFFAERIRESTVVSGPTRSQYDFVLHNLLKSQIVCRTAFCICYGISDAQLKALCKKVRKGNNHRVATEERHVAYTDGTIPDETFASGLDIISDELSYEARQHLRNYDAEESQTEVATFLGPHAEFARLMLTPVKSVKKMACVQWLQRYCEESGDYAPNEGEIKLNIKIKAVYDEYVKYAVTMQDNVQRAEEEKEDIDIPAARNFNCYISYSEFCNLWGTVFPYCVVRPYVDIPGKCRICFEIDRQRRICEDNVVKKMLTRAHFLHKITFTAERKQ